MNRKQFALILFALIIVGAAGLILINRNRQSWNVREARVGDKVPCPISGSMMWQRFTSKAPARNLML